MGGETRFAYFPAATVSDGTAVSVQAATDPTITQAGGEKSPKIKRLLENKTRVLFVIQSRLEGNFA